MKRINVFMLLCLLVLIAGYSQEARIVYVDNKMRDNSVNGVIEDNDGNFVYVGSNGDRDYAQYAMIVKVSPDGNVVMRKDFAGNTATDDIDLSLIFLTENNTYFTMGTLINTDGVHFITKESSTDLEILAEYKTKIHDHAVNSSLIEIHSKEYEKGKYITLLYYYYDGLMNSFYDVCIVDRHGGVYNRKSAYYEEVNGGNAFPYNVIPLNGGQTFLLLTGYGYLVYDAELNFVKMVSFLTYEGTFEAREEGTDGIAFSDGSIRYFHAQGSFVDQPPRYSFSVVSVDDEIINNPKPTTKAFFVDEYGGMRMLANCQACSYVTDDNLIFGGTIYHREVPQAFWWSETSVVVSSYNKFTNSLNWHGVFDGGDYHYTAKSIFATKDGGGIVSAVKKKQKNNGHHLA